MGFSFFKYSIEKIFKKQPDKKVWLDKLIDNLETKLLEDASVPFKIVELKREGFVVKVSGLYAFVLFNFMPWKYSNINYWTSVSPTLIGKVFYCKIHSIKKINSTFSIMINGNILQFKKIELIIGENYRGIVLEKVGTGIFVDAGFHFDWRFGSFVGYMHHSQFDSVELFTRCSVGDEIDVLYQGLNEKGQTVYSQTNEMAEWNEGIPQDMVGQIVLVYVIRDEDDKKTKLLVNGKYKGRLIYSFGSKQSIRKMKNSLKEGTIIHCEVIGFNEKNHILKLKWVMELDGEFIDMEIADKISKKNNIMNNLDSGTIQKLKAMKEVEEDT